MFHNGIPLVTTLLLAYVAWRASSVPAIRRRVRRRWILAAAALLWLVCLLGRCVGHESHGTAASVLEQLGLGWTVAMLLITVALLPVELLTGFGLLLKRRAPSLRGWAMLVGLGLAVAAVVQGRRAPVVRTHEVRITELPAGLDRTVVVAASDLHLGNTLDARWLTARVDQILAQKPDLILLLGDIFEGHDPVSPQVLAQLRRLSAPLGQFAVTGNHEHHGPDEGRETLRTAGFTVLGDRSVPVRPGLILAGVDDLTRRRRRGQATAQVVKRVLSRAPPGAVIYLSHAPLHPEVAAAAGAELMLAGHTHGGQIWPLGYLVRLAYPLVGGRYLVDGMPAIVCRGTGTWGPRMRLWRPGEILRITLRR